MSHSRLEQALGYEFHDPALLTRALTHRSAGSANFERLEFLGDAMLGYLVGEWLYQAHPQAPESALTLMRASLVRRETLAEVALEISLGDHVLMGPGEHKSGGKRRSSILADALEAVLGAVLQDGGLEAARGVTRRLLGERLDAASPAGGKDPKTRLQEYLQARGLRLPEYRLRAELGDAHAPTFEIECAVDALSISTTAIGTSRRAAEKAAAQCALEELERGHG